MTTAKTVAKKVSVINNAACDRPRWGLHPKMTRSQRAPRSVVSSTLERVDWNAELLRGDLGKAIRQLKRDSGKGLFVAGVKLPLALAELGIDR